MSTVRDTKKIDLVTLDKANSMVKLIMIEDREWGSDGGMYEQLQDKLSNYIFYIQEGQLKDDYPEYASASPAIQIDYVYPLDEYSASLINRMREILEDKNISFFDNYLHDG